MKHSLRKKLLATTIISICSVANAYAVDKLDKAQLVNAAKQIGQSSEFENFEASLEPENVSKAKITKAETIKIGPTADIDKHKHKPMGVLPTEQSIRKRLALHGKQKLVIHDQGQKLQLSIEALTKVLATSSINSENEPISAKDKLSKSSDADVVINPAPKEEKLKESEHIPEPNKLKESVSQLKILFAAKVQTNDSKQKTSINHSATEN
jgi:hypothetical protein